MAPIIIGIVAIITSFIFPMIGIIVSIAGVIVGIIGCTKKDKNSIIGLVLSIIALLLGLLMTFVTIKSTENTIDNSRKSMFSTIAKEYINSVNDAVISESVICSTTASEELSNQFTKPTNNGDYYIFISSGENTIIDKFSSFDSNISNKASEQSKELMGYGNKSPWRSKDVYGYVHFNLNNNEYTYSIALADVDGHGISKELEQQNIKRESIETKDVKVDMNKVLKLINDDSNYYCHLK